MSGACPRLGFDVRVVVDDNVPSSRAEVIREIFVREVLVPNALTGTGASVHAGHWLYTISRESEQATHTDRELVSAWLSGRHEIADFDVGPLVDLR